MVGDESPRIGFAGAGAACPQIGHSSPQAAKLQISKRSLEPHWRCYQDTGQLFHMGVRTALAARGAELLYLPAHSLDLNPIKFTFAKLKAALACGGRARL
jgi:hypothetical protein